jgi:hypothetical protein
MELRKSQPHTRVSDVHPLMTALGRGLPITLLVDLIDPNGPRSAEMLERERPACDDVRYSVAGRIA